MTIVQLESNFVINYFKILPKFYRMLFFPQTLATATQSEGNIQHPLYPGQNKIDQSIYCTLINSFSLKYNHSQCCSAVSQISWQSQHRHSPHAALPPESQMWSFLWKKYGYNCTQDVLFQIHHQGDNLQPLGR